MAACLFAACGLLPTSTSAKTTDDSPSSPPLTLEEVFRAVELRHPESEIAARDVEKAKGAKLSALGGWDPTLKMSGYTVPFGYYKYSSVETMVRQETPWWGLGLSAGYRGAWGKLPIYRLDRETLPGGELRVGADLPLWKDRAIDDQRADVQSRNLDVAAADCRQDMTRLRLSLDAATTYWDWVQAGQEVKIQSELLEWATQRDLGLRAQADHGQIPEIVVVDNRRLVLERQSKQVKAEQTFQEATIKLSLFLRDAENQTIEVDAQRLPAFSELVTPASGLIREGDVERALAQRPELCELEKSLASAHVDLKLARNRVAPQVNVQGYVAKDLGRGDPSLSPTEAGGALVLSIPLALRAARGKAKQAEASVASLVAKYRGQVDKVRSEVRLARIKLDAAFQQARLAHDQKLVADQLVLGERERFEQGVSTLVIVNLRELAAAQAASAVVAAAADYERAKLGYLIALGERF